MSARSSPERRRSVSPLEWFVEVAILAPIKVGTAFVEASPQIVDQIRRQLARGASRAITDSASVILDATAPDAGDEQARPDAGSLVLPDYDHLSSAHIVSKLASLDPAERDAIEAYESATRHRRTILNKLDQLRDAP